MNKEQEEHEDKELGTQLNEALLQKIGLDTLYKPVLGSMFEWSFLEPLTEKLSYQ